MTEDTEMETTLSLSSTGSIPASTLEQFLELIRHFKTDPNKETVEASADSLKMAKGFGSYMEGMRWGSSSCPRATHLGWSQGNTASQALGAKAWATTTWPTGLV